MSLVEHYVDAVRQLLPRQGRDDIAAELRETLLSHIEEAEREGGRPLTDNEIGEVLKRYGSPEAVAVRYGARSYLIGPSVYPQYKAVVRFMLWILGIVFAVGLVVTPFTADHPVTAMARVALTGVVVVIVNLTIVTLTFARIERLKSYSDSPERWDPRDLMHTPGLRRTFIPRAESVGSLLMTVFWLLWWTDVLPINKWLLWSKLPLAPGGIWDALTPLIVSAMVAGILVSAITIVQPRWMRFHEAAGLLLDIVIGVILLRALRAPELIVLTGSAPSVATLANLFTVLLKIGFILWGVGILVSIGATVRRWAGLAGQSRAFA
jgi:hypothetical protein